MALAMRTLVIIGHLVTNTTKLTFRSQNLTILAMVNEFPPKNLKPGETDKNLSVCQKKLFFQKLSYISYQIWLYLCKNGSLLAM